MRFSLDTNVLVYAAPTGVDRRRSAAVQIVRRATASDCVLTTQCLQEFFFATVRKRLLSAADARRAALDLLNSFQSPAPVTAAALRRAMLEAEQRRFDFWDALLMASAGEAGCEAVISEDMHPGAMLGRVRVVPAFDQAGAISPEAHALLA